ncbi:hypothetical protein RF11_04959 [Thelohanellus kitauei]|uniref:Sortilin N-terminal domain-containing protein n=1 Tax=Thelohanellus kitauei TaxID=669202 RepID=A0A0C2MNA6_THEKT|nr:hypothetical protein RF11_04959 [Thelohanellus kitauei]
MNDDQTKTYVSFDNGENFQALKLEENDTECHPNNCWIELDLTCKDIQIKNHFPENSIVQFKGKYHKYGSTSRHIFVSFNAGNSWKMLDSRIDNLFIINHGQLLFGIQSTSGNIGYSYDEGSTWFFENNGLDNLIDVIPIGYPHYDLIGVIAF